MHWFNIGNEPVNVADLNAAVDYFTIHNTL